MNKNQAHFHYILGAIEGMTKECEKILSEYYTNRGSFSNMSIRSFNVMVNDCRGIQKRMDIFCTRDLYHIIGMANLNAAQMSRIIKATKKLLKYRSDVKALASQNTIRKSIKRSEESKYRLSSGLELTKKMQQVLRRDEL